MLIISISFHAVVCVVPSVGFSNGSSPAVGSRVKRNKIIKVQYIQNKGCILWEDTAVKHPCQGENMRLTHLSYVPVQHVFHLYHRWHQIHDCYTVKGCELPRASEFRQVVSVMWLTHLRGSTVNYSHVCDYMTNGCLTLVQFVAITR